MSTPIAVPHKVKTKLVELTVKPEQMKLKGAWPREIQILNRLVARYPDPEFWNGFSVPFALNSMAFLLTDKGATLLADAYRLYTFHKTQQNSIDTVDKPAKLVEDVTEVTPVKKRENALSWADDTKLL